MPAGSPSTPSKVEAADLHSNTKRSHDSSRLDIESAREPTSSAHDIAPASSTPRDHSPRRDALPRRTTSPTVESLPAMAARLASPIASANGLFSGCSFLEHLIGGMEGIDQRIVAWLGASELLHAGASPIAHFTGHTPPLFGLVLGCR